ncbi:MAG TPA: sigma-70 family RNA polymerase sigma factor [Isosphaeraceae bacterium]|nr:sigma-70 family RNA polymerase sigma factor [Isosphaeraceae bacterium]
MKTSRQDRDAVAFAALDGDATRVLTAKDERELLDSLADCRRTLAEAHSRSQWVDRPAGADDPEARAHDRAAGPNPAAVKVGAVWRRYNELRTKLALANVRLVAHIAKPYRHRGIPSADLMQEGFCGLLEAIDRFEVNHGTKLATYATWWIRQAMQRAVASGAYPVRLTPRHLRQLAQNQEFLERCRVAMPAVADREAGDGDGLSPLIQRLCTATRPALSLDTAFGGGSACNLVPTVSDSDGDSSGDLDTKEMVARLLQALGPREREVLALRYGLTGRPKRSLTEVGERLKISKERVRQIQARALEKLRAAAETNQAGTRWLAGI